MVAPFELEKYKEMLPQRMSVRRSYLARSCREDGLNFTMMLGSGKPKPVPVEQQAVDK